MPVERGRSSPRPKSPSSSSAAPVGFRWPNEERLVGGPLCGSACNRFHALEKKGLRYIILRIMWIPGHLRVRYSLLPAFWRRSCSSFCGHRKHIRAADEVKGLVQIMASSDPVHWTASESNRPHTQVASILTGGAGRQRTKRVGNPKAGGGQFAMLTA